LQIATENFEKDSEYIRELKILYDRRLEAVYPSLVFNGDPKGKSLLHGVKRFVSKNRTIRNASF
jgi:hypothetical protein